MTISFREKFGGRFLDCGGLVCNVRHPEFGARGDGSTDDTAAIQAAVNTGTTAVVPKGRYRIDHTIYLTLGTHLHLMEGAQFVRAAGGSTEPLVVLMGNDAKLTGTGEVATESASPKGIVRVGTLVEDRLATINWTHVDGITIWGNGDERSVGLDFFSTEPTVGGSNYQCNARNLKIAGVGTGVRLSKWCNAHMFSNVFFYRIGRVVWDFDQCMESAVFGGFVHDSHDVTCIRMRDCQYVQLYGFLAEPGGEHAVYYRISSDNIQCTIIGHGNCAGGPVNESASTTILDLGQLRVPHLTAGSLRTSLGGVVQGSRLAEGEVTSRTAGVFVLSDPTKEGFLLSPLRRATSEPARAGAFFEVTVSGFAVQANGAPRTYQGKWLVTPYNGSDGARRLVVGGGMKPLNVTATVREGEQGVILRLAGFRGCRAGEVICEVRECGLPVEEVRVGALG